MRFVGCYHLMLYRFVLVAMFMLYVPFWNTAVKCCFVEDGRVCFVLEH